MAARVGELEHRRRRRRPLVIGFVLVVVGWLALASAQLVLTWREATLGREAAARAEAEIDASAVGEGTAIGDLRDASRLFSRAERRLEGLAVAPLRLLPVLGRQLRALERLAETAAEASDVLAGLAALGERIAEDPPGDGGERVHVADELADAVAAAHARLAAADLGPDEALVGPVLEARTEVGHRLAEATATLERGAATSRLVADMLAGPRRLLVLAANNSEMRSGSGMFLSAGVLTIDDGTFDLSAMRRTTDVPTPPAPAALTGDLAARWGWTAPNVEWRNLGLTPRFDATAELAARMWEASGERPVDGVLAVDAVAVRALLQATGPVDVDGRSIAADEVVPFVLHDQYLSLSEDVRERDEDQAERREVIGILARAAVGALDERAWDAAELVEGLADAAEGRHLLLWSADAHERAVLEAAGVGGTLGPESLLVSLANTAGKKLDYFVEVDAELELAPRRDGSTDALLRLHVANTTPADEHPYILGPNPNTTGLGPGDYRALLTVSLPGVASDARVDAAEGLGRTVASGPDGATIVHAVEVEVPRGARRTFALRFVVPGSGTMQVEASARVPAVRWNYEGQRWNDDDVRRISWGAGHGTNRHEGTSGPN